MHRKKMICVAGFVAVLAAPVVVFVRLANAGKPDRNAPRVISLEWRRDVWLPPAIRTMDLNGDNQFHVSRDADLLRGGWPRWSPDGKRLGGYYKYLRDDNGDTDGFAMMSIAADGTDEQVVVSLSQVEAYGLSGMGVAAWGPLPEKGEHQMMVFQAGASLFLADTETGDIAPLTLNVGQNYGDWTPHWSWSLNKIAFVSNRSGNRELWMINPDGTGLRQLTNFQGSFDGEPISELEVPVWDPTGTQIAFETKNPMYYGSRLYGDWNVWILDVDLDDETRTYPVTNVDKVFNDPNMAEIFPAWGPDGTELVYIRLFDQNSRNRNFELVIHDFLNETETVIAEATKQAFFYPDWNHAAP